MSPRTIRAEALTPEAYAPFGAVLAATEKHDRLANQGRARVWDRQTDLVNLRDDASANVSIFRCAPAIDRPVPLRVLERHVFSTQLFIPMQATRYLVVVAPGGDAPELNKIRAFVASGAQGIAYHAGTWHHPMIALDSETDFVCIVHENRSAGDCTLASIDSAILVDLM